MNATERNKFGSALLPYFYYSHVLLLHHKDLVRYRFFIFRFFSAAAAIVRTFNFQRTDGSTRRRGPAMPIWDGGCSNKPHSRESSSSCAKRSHHDACFYPPVKVLFNQWIISFIPRRKIMVVFIHRRKGIFYQWIISFIPRRNDGCFYPPEKVLFTDGLLPSLPRGNDGCFYPREKGLFTTGFPSLPRRKDGCFYPPEKGLWTNGFTFIPRLIPRSTEESDLKTRSLPPTA